MNNGANTDPRWLKIEPMAVSLAGLRNCGILLYAGVSSTWGRNDASTHHLGLSHYRSSPELEDRETVHITHRTHVIWPRPFPIPRRGIWYSPPHFSSVDYK
jgi:hypothetical protein